MECLYCGGKMQKEFSTYTINKDGFHLFVEKIPVHVCTRCGEKHFAEEEVDAIQDMIRCVDEKVKHVQMAMA